MAQTNYLNAIHALGVLEGTYDGLVSAQLLAVDMKLKKVAGSSTAASPSYLAPVMGNVKEDVADDGLTATKSIVAGVIAKNDVSGTISSTYPSAAMYAEIGDKSSTLVGVLSAMGGDSGSNTKPRAMFGVDWQQSTVASSVSFGLDLEGVIHDSYAAPRYGKGLVRLGGRFSNAGTVETVNDLLVLAGTAAPTNGASGTGAGDADAGSLYVRQSGSSSKIYINGNTKASPTWNLVTSA